MQPKTDRDEAKTRKEIDKYAFGELIAELGAALPCAKLQVVQTPRGDHPHYIKSWLKALKDDKTCIFKASAQAAKAIYYVYLSIRSHRRGVAD